MAEEESTTTSSTSTTSSKEEESGEITADELRELARLVYNLMLQEIRQERERR